MKSVIRRIIPRAILDVVIPIYHFALALLGALIYGFPSRKLVVIGVTGTKGKSSTTEILGGILEAGGYKHAILGTIQFKIGDQSERNLRKMTMPGRFFVQKFLRDAVRAGCTHAIIEMTSEGAKQFRQRFIDMDALIFTNLAPEHIESHGTYEKYRDAKLAIARTLSRSNKVHRFMVANTDDKESGLFLSIPHVSPVPYALADATNLLVTPTNIAFSWRDQSITNELGGKFNVYNMLGAMTCADALGIPLDAIQKGVARTTAIPGRMERIEAGQKFPVIVDYAHTPDSLEALYQAFGDTKKICVLGNTGGGRDTWKRPIMGALAEEYCDTIILANEDPYDEDPNDILTQMSAGIKTKQPEIILDRRLAIARALTVATNTADSVVLITGKGTDPFIMGPNGTKTPWDDRTVAREEIAKIQSGGGA